MDRREFLRASLLGAAAVSVAPMDLLGKGASVIKRGKTPELKISFQEGNAPGKTLAERFDFMEEHGVVGFEPHGRNLASRINEFQQLLRGRNIQVSAICAGYEGFILTEDANLKRKFDSSMRDLIAAAGELGSTGVILVPAFNGQVPVRPHTMETRQFLIEELQQLGDHALQHNTTVILEPLNRKEAFYLRQMADAASICRDANHKGVRCLGDFWHMTFEESSDFGALMSAGEYLQHMHIASRGRRKTPSEDGELDNYIEGFRALKRINYPHYLSFECGCEGDREKTNLAALELIRDQWNRA